MSGQRPSVLIVGGGLAGLSAAADLVEAGARVTLVESKATLGGRAASFTDPQTGESIDNCQHVTMGCCTHLADFCRRVGIDHLLRTLPWLDFIDADGRVSRLRSLPLPAPFHQSISFLRLTFLTWPEKLQVMYGLLRLWSETTWTGGSFLDWLQHRRQTPRTCERFWGLILTSALNETLDRIDYRYARQVFVNAFLSRRHHSSVQVPTVPLGEFYGKPIEQWLTTHGVDLRLGVPVRSLDVEGDRVIGMTLLDGARIGADSYILAVPFQRVPDLLPADLLHREPALQRLQHLELSPISSVHFWFDRPVMNQGHLVVVGRTIQWIFVRPSAAGQYVQVVTSAARPFAAMDKHAVQQQVLQELSAVLPRVQQAQIVRHRVVTDRQATFSVVPGVDELRPEGRVGQTNLYLAGDYTLTGWPATMESAVISGQTAARAVLQWTADTSA